MKRINLLATGCVIPFLAAGQSNAQTQAVDVDVKAGSLGYVAAELGAQAGITVVLADAPLAAKHSRGVRGRMPLRRAFDRLLQGTGAEAVFLDKAIVRIRQRRAVLVKPKHTPVPSPPEPPESLEIFVTASKQDQTLTSYPGTVKIVRLEPGWLADHAGEGTGAITGLLPALGSTNLGSGRNKVFIRGIADSSFSGPTQATTGHFLGDVRMAYNAPDPDLNLYDMARVEVLVGPQGTLYGAGSLGGIIRLVPTLPDPHSFAGAANMNVGATNHGGPNIDGAMVVNLPLGGGTAIRLVGYGGRASGYIDAPLQGRRDVNDRVSYGHRIAFRAADVGGWTFDAAAVMQNVRTGDGQYVLRSDPSLERNGLIPQPFENNYRLGYVTAARAIGRVELVSISSLVHHNLASVFDATGYDGGSSPSRYTEDNRFVLISHETRLAGGGSGAPWVAGVALMANRSRLSIAFDRSDQPRAVGRVLNVQTEVALFGQMSRPITSTVSATAGGRLTMARSSREVMSQAVEIPADPGRTAARFSGTLGLTWSPTSFLSTFYHYQQGYRAGGTGLTFTDNRLAIRKFAPDDLYIHELGLRWGVGAKKQFSGQAAIFVADWRNIQADVIGEFPVPYTTNVGRGNIRGLDVEMTWRPVASLTLNASAFLNDSRLTKAAPDLVLPVPGGKLGRSLPNVARNGARFSAAWQTPLGRSAQLTVDGSVRYIGKSHLGLGEMLDIPQGDYAVFDLAGRLVVDRFAVSLNLSNVADARSNTFSYGNPFVLTREDQQTPLRPRTITLGLGVSF